MTTLDVLGKITPGDVGLLICHCLADQILTSRAINSLGDFSCAVMPDKFVMVLRRSIVN